MIAFFYRISLLLIGEENPCQGCDNAKDESLVAPALAAYCSPNFCPGFDLTPVLGRLLLPSVALETVWGKLVFLYLYSLLSYAVFYEVPLCAPIVSK